MKMTRKAVRGRTLKALFANLIAMATLVMGVVTYSVSEDRGTLVRNSLIAQRAIPQDFSWMPDNVPPGFLLESLRPPDIFEEVADAILEGASADGLPALERAKRIVEHLNQKTGDGQSIQKDLTTTYYLVTNNGQGYCADYTQTFIALAHAMDVDVREWGLGFGGFGAGHAFNEIYSPEYGKWIFIDPFHSFYALDKSSGEPLSVEEFRNRVATEAPAPPTIVPIGEDRFRFKSEAAAVQYYARAANFFYMFWGNNVYEYDESQLIKSVGRFSRSAELLAAIAVGKYPRILLLETGTNRLAIREITRLRFTLFASLGVFVVLSALLVYQILVLVGKGSWPALGSTQGSVGGATAKL